MALVPWYLIPSSMNRGSCDLRMYSPRSVARRGRSYAPYHSGTVAKTPKFRQVQDYQECQCLAEIYSYQNYVAWEKFDEHCCNHNASIQCS